MEWNDAAPKGFPVLEAVFVCFVLPFASLSSAINSLSPAHLQYIPPSYWDWLKHILPTLHHFASLMPFMNQLNMVMRTFVFPLRISSSRGFPAKNFSFRDFFSSRVFYTEVF